ncbi:MAG: hypothetical protein LBU06_04410 [Desulfovibrio sp.]|jgi:hypothetical protein|nr:hypothetical protein [Desulfovibrio sp.]
MPIGITWKYGIAAGAGVAVGLLGVVLLSRGSVNPKKSCAALSSRCVDIKDRAAATVETAKENSGCIAAKARREPVRKGQAQGS